MKFQDVENESIELLIRANGSSGRFLDIVNMENKNIIGTSDWIQYSVKLPYSKDVKTISIAAGLSGKGKLWVDDFELLIDGVDYRIAKSKYLAYNDYEFDNGSKINNIKLTDKKITNLKLLGMIWGFLKYYHPSIAKGNYNWDYELFRVLPHIVNAENSKDRDNYLLKWIKGLGKFDISKQIENEDNEIISKPDLDWITNSNLSEKLTTQLVKVKNAKRTNQHYYIGYNKEIKIPEFKNEKTYSEMLYPDSGFRLLALYRYWNIIQYYFPYKNLIEEDWKNLLEEFIPKIINSKDKLEYRLALLELVVRIRDSHAVISISDRPLNKYKGVNWTQISTSFIENKVVVTNIGEHGFTKENGLKIGDIITKVDKKTIKDIVNDRIKYTSGSNYSTQLRNISESLLRSNDTIVNIEYVRDTEIATKNIKTSSLRDFFKYKRNNKKDTCFRFVSPKIGYIYLGTIKNKYMPQIIDKIKNTKGLIIDIRCYPSEMITKSLGDYLVSESNTFAKMSVASISKPGLFTIKKSVTIGKKTDDFYKGKVIVLVNQSTISRAEFTAMALKKVPDVTFIGSTTAGADGSVTKFYLPGGIKTMMSGMGIYYPNGDETQRVGILSDIEIKPTIKGIKNDKDELLDKAIEIINNK